MKPELWTPGSSSVCRKEQLGRWRQGPKSCLGASAECSQSAGVSCRGSWASRVSSRESAWSPPQLLLRSSSGPARPGTKPESKVVAIFDWDFVAIFDFDAGLSRSRLLNYVGSLELTVNALHPLRVSVAANQNTLQLAGTRLRSLQLLS